MQKLASKKEVDRDACRKEGFSSSRNYPIASFGAPFPPNCPKRLHFIGQACLIRGDLLSNAHGITV
jgi:hypothetical protein